MRLALVNQPEEQDHAINFGETFYTIEGTAVNSVTLIESSGTVLLRSCAMDTAPQPSISDQAAQPSCWNRL